MSTKSPSFHEVADKAPLVNNSRDSVVPLRTEPTTSRTTLAVSSPLPIRQQKVYAGLTYKTSDNQTISLDCGMASNGTTAQGHTENSEVTSISNPLRTTSQRTG